ncbi:MAG: murein L,D-transpeptidase [Sphingobacteriales bacterium]|nr:MAG: murein L,D-transpeptidase [Sphingobacteriales bacterium]
MKNILFALLTCSLFACNTSTEEKKPATPEWKEQEAKHVKTQYTIASVKQMSIDTFKAKYNQQQQDVILALNRVDINNLKKADTIVVPSDASTNLMEYSIFPYNLASIKDVKKIIFFSYGAQAWGAYENGHLVKWGPTNMGRQNAQTPTGLFFANWKAEETRSTVDDEWILKWNFNIANKDGVGWHQYEMPGYPASHSCLRLFEADAKYLYDWADQWIQKNEQELLAQGTPVIVFGSYPFGQPKPWLALAQNPDALDITPDAMDKLVTPNLDKILKEQQNREQVAAQKESK